ncbi:hypothetical protein EON65_52195, partial [archaeon]
MLFFTVIRSIGFTQLGPHFCCLLQYYPYTLMSLLIKAKPNMDADIKTEFALPSHIVRPKFTRKLFSKEKAERTNGISVAAAAADIVGLTLDNIHVVKKLAFHLLCALSILHKQGIVHGDVKPENCFLSAPSLCADSTPHPSSP